MGAIVIDRSVLDGSVLDRPVLDRSKVPAVGRAGGPMATAVIWS